MAEPTPAPPTEAGRSSTPATPELPREPAPPREPSASPNEGLPPEPLEGAGTTFNIGVDVGTSTTKCCVRPPGAGSSGPRPGAWAELPVERALSIARGPR